MKILVVGGTGTVGSETVRRLLSRKADVRVLTSSPDKVKKLPAGLEGVVADIRDKNSLRDYSFAITTKVTYIKLCLLF